MSIGHMVEAEDQPMKCLDIRNHLRYCIDVHGWMEVDIMDSEGVMTSILILREGILVNTRVNDTAICHIIWGHAPTTTLRYRDILPSMQPEMRFRPRCPGHSHRHRVRVITELH